MGKYYGCLKCFAAIVCFVSGTLIIKWYPLLSGQLGILSLEMIFRRR